MTAEITFSNPAASLMGTLTTPAGSGPFPVVLVLHPAGEGTRSSWLYEHLTRLLPTAGIAVFVYDRRGSGASTGDADRASYHDLAEDGLSALWTLAARSDIDPERIALYGISQGGWLAPLIAARAADVAALAIVSSSGVSPAEQMTYGVARHLREAGFDEEAVREALRAREQVDAHYRGRGARADVLELLRAAAGRPWFDHAYLPTPDELPERPARSNWGQVLDYDPVPVWRQLRQPTLFVFAEDDAWVPVEASLSAFRRATAHLGRVWFERVRGSDHLMCDLARRSVGGPPVVSEGYQGLLVAWLATVLRVSAP